MAKFRKFTVGVVVGSCLGLWAGVNIGKGQPIWANPFKQRSLAQQASDQANKMLKDAKRAVRESLKE